MEILDLLLGRDRRRRTDDIGDVIGGMSKWIMRCGCLLLVAIIAGVVAVVMGFVSLGEDGVTVTVVVITMIVAVASLIRTSSGY